MPSSITTCAVPSVSVTVSSRNNSASGATCAAAASVSTSSGAASAGAADRPSWASVVGEQRRLQPVAAQVAILLLPRGRRHERGRGAVAGERAGQAQRAQPVEQRLLLPQRGFIVRGPHDEELRAGGDPGDRLHARLLGDQRRCERLHAPHVVVAPHARGADHRDDDEDSQRRQARRAQRRRLPEPPQQRRRRQQQAAMSRRAAAVEQRQPERHGRERGEQADDGERRHLAQPGERCQQEGRVADDRGDQAKRDARASPAAAVRAGFAAPGLNTSAQ